MILLQSNNNNNMNKQSQHVLFFYKGSTIPAACAGWEEEEIVMKLAKETIVRGLRDGKSLEQQKADYVQQLDKLEQALQKSQKAGFMKHEMYKEACKSVDKMEDTFHALWSLNICALIILKVIKDDDDMNGVMKLNMCKCGQICVDAEDRLCHECYHQSVGDKECYCNEII